MPCRRAWPPPMQALVDGMSGTPATTAPTPAATTATGGPAAPSSWLDELRSETLVSQGLTGREIAERLVISGYAVKNHIRNVLEKPHLKNRAEAVAFALQEGLLERPRRQGGPRQKRKARYGKRMRPRSMA